MAIKEFNVLHECPVLEGQGEVWLAANQTTAAHKLGANPLISSINIDTEREQDQVEICGMGGRAVKLKLIGDRMVGDESLELSCRGCGLLKGGFQNLYTLSDMPKETREPKGAQRLPNDRLLSS